MPTSQFTTVIPSRRIVACTDATTTVLATVKSLSDFVRLQIFTHYAMPDSWLSAVIHSYDDHEVRPLYAIILDVIQHAYRSSTITLANPMTHHLSRMLRMRSVSIIPTAITSLVFQDNITMTFVMVMWHFS